MRNKWSCSKLINEVTVNILQKDNDEVFRMNSLRICEEVFGERNYLIQVVGNVGNIYSEEKLSICFLLI